MTDTSHAWSSVPGDWRYCLNCGCHHPDELSTPEGLVQCGEPTSLRKMPYYHWYFWTQHRPASFNDWCKARGADPVVLKAQHLAWYTAELTPETMAKLRIDADNHQKYLARYEGQS